MTVDCTAGQALVPEGAALQIQDLSLHRPLSQASILAAFDLHVTPGETVALTGPSGSGKSTLLLAVAGLHPVAAGRISLGGVSVADWDAFRLARVVLLLALAEQDKETFLDTLATLLNTADLREQAAIYSALPLLPHGGELVEAAHDAGHTAGSDIYFTRESTHSLDQASIKMIGGAVAAAVSRRHEQG
jgi:ABC-type transport system involved in cytochrome bd biosynthesis fused ATPase/permease subunit